MKLKWLQRLDKQIQMILAPIHLIRAALIYNLNNGVTFRAMGSSGFRAPSLYERYSASYGNKNLKPEEKVKHKKFGAEKFTRMVHLLDLQFLTQKLII